MTITSEHETINYLCGYTSEPPIKEYFYMIIRITKLPVAN